MDIKEELGDVRRYLEKRKGGSSRKKEIVKKALTRKIPTEKFRLIEEAPKELKSEEERFQYYLSRVNYLSQKGEYAEAIGVIDRANDIYRETASSYLEDERTEAGEAMEKRVIRLMKRAIKDKTLSLDQAESVYGMGKNLMREIEKNKRGNKLEASLKVIAMIVIGSSLFFLSTNITGMVVGNLSNGSANILGLCLLTCGLMLGLFSFRKKIIRKK